jgi:uncharacterized protein
MPETSLVASEAEKIAEMSALVADLVRMLVDEPGAVTVSTVAGVTETSLLVRVAAGDVGKVIGKQGRTARSLRTIVGAASMKLHHRFSLDIVEAE